MVDRGARWGYRAVVMASFESRVLERETAPGGFIGAYAAPRRCQQFRGVPSASLHRPSSGIAPE